MKLISLFMVIIAGSGLSINRQSAGTERTFQQDSLRFSCAIGVFEDSYALRCSSMLPETPNRLEDVLQEWANSQARFSQGVYEFEITEVDEIFKTKVISHGKAYVNKQLPVRIDYCGKNDRLITFVYTKQLFTFYDYEGKTVFHFPNRLRGVLINKDQREKLSEILADGLGCSAMQNALFCYAVALPIADIRANYSIDLVKDAKDGIYLQMRAITPEAAAQSADLLVVLDSTSYRVRSIRSKLPMAALPR